MSCETGFLCNTGFLPVTGGHTIYYEVYGPPKVPLLLIHGGPGGGIQRGNISLYKKFQVITFDQRGCGKSTPFGSLKNNTTWDLVEDIEALRKHLGIEKWFISGGSWGTTLGLVYAETHPERVRGLLLRSVCLIDSMSNKWLYERGGASEIYPEKWVSFVGVLPPRLREAGWRDIMAYYQKKLQGADAMKFARAWWGWEHAVSFLHPRKDDTPDSEILSLALIENHYFVHNCWIDEGQIVRDAHRLKGIPIVTVHGRYDMVCPNKGSFDLQAVAPQTKIILAHGGHAGSEPGTLAAQKKAIAMLYSTKRKIQKTRKAGRA
jgi:proline iminopeptidase